MLRKRYMLQMRIALYETAQTQSAPRRDLAMVALEAVLFRGKAERLSALLVSFYVAVIGILE